MSCHNLYGSDCTLFNDFLQYLFLTILLRLSVSAQCDKNADHQYDRNKQDAFYHEDSVDDFQCFRVGFKFNQVGAQTMHRHLSP